MDKNLPIFMMPFEPMTIEHLGLRLYSTLPPVLVELVSNSYDAESNRVEISLPKGPINEKSEVVLRDFGHGMTPEEMAGQYLPIGKNRRETIYGDMSKNKKVRVMGRKGLGKLSSFGVAKEMEVRSISNKFAVCLRINYDEMLNWPKIHPGKAFEPSVVKELTGPTKDTDGMEVKLRGLHRRRAIDEDLIRKGIARRLTIIGRSFEVLVNGNGIKPGDRMSRTNCVEDQSWDLDDTPAGTKISDDLEVTGWIGFLPSSSQSGRGIDVFANGKAVELESFFNYASTHAQFARAHLVGEVHADFLDRKNDLIATARNKVVWESDLGEALEQWGQDLVKWALKEWTTLREKEKEENIIRTSKFNEWLKLRPPSEQLVARRMVKLLVRDPHMEPTSMAPILDIVKSSVETVAFRELVERIEEKGSSPSTLLQLFEEWRIIEAREHLKLADGRTAAIDQLEKLMESGALEVKQMQPLFAENLWLLNRAWTKADIQPAYTKLLREHCKEPKRVLEKDRRLDIYGVTGSGILTVVELKKSEKTVSRMDLEQIERYVDWARTNIIGTGEDAPKYAHGLLIVGKQSSQGDVAKKMERLRGDDIRVETYRDLHARSREYYSAIEDQLKTIAPEYARKLRLKTKKN